MKSDPSPKPLGTKVGRAMVAVSLFCNTACPPFFWFNQEHAGSPTWPPHARFHLTWMTCLVMGLGLLTLPALLAWWDTEPKIRLVVTAVPLLLISSYFMAGFVVVPAVVGIADAFQERTPIVVFGYSTHLAGFYVLAALAVGGYWIDHRARRRAKVT